MAVTGITARSYSRKSPCLTHTGRLYVGQQYEIASDCYGCIHFEYLLSLDRSSNESNMYYLMQD